MKHGRGWAFGMRLLAGICLSFGLTAVGANAQTINGTLMEVESGQPISLGLVIMMTETGDSVTSGVTKLLSKINLLKLSIPSL